MRHEIDELAAGVPAHLQHARLHLQLVPAVDAACTAKNTVSVRLPRCRPCRHSARLRYEGYSGAGNRSTFESTSAKHISKALHTWAERAREEQRVLQGCSRLQRGKHKLLGAIAQVCAVQLQASPRVQA